MGCDFLGWLELRTGRRRSEDGFVRSGVGGGCLSYCFGDFIANAVTVLELFLDVLMVRDGEVRGTMKTERERPSCLEMLSEVNLRCIDAVRLCYWLVVMDWNKNLLQGFPLFRIMVSQLVKLCHFSCLVMNKTFFLLLYFFRFQPLFLFAILFLLVCSE